MQKSSCPPCGGLDYCMGFLARMQRGAADKPIFSRFVAKDPIWRPLFLPLRLGATAKRRLIEIFEDSRAASGPIPKNDESTSVAPFPPSSGTTPQNGEAPPLLRRRATGQRRLRSASRAQADLPSLSPILKANAPEPAPRINSRIRFSQLRRDSLFFTPRSAPAGPSPGRAQPRPSPPAPAQHESPTRVELTPSKSKARRDP